MPKEVLPQDKPIDSEDIAILRNNRRIAMFQRRIDKLTERKNDIENINVQLTAAKQAKDKIK